MNGKFDLAVVALQPTWITQCPLLLLDTRMPYGSLSVGCEEHLDPAGTGSLYNEGEAEIVLQHVFSLIYAGNHIWLLKGFPFGNIKVIKHCPLWMFCGIINKKL